MEEGGGCRYVRGAGLGEKLELKGEVINMGTFSLVRRTLDAGPLG